MANPKDLKRKHLKRFDFKTFDCDKLEPQKQLELCPVCSKAQAEKDAKRARLEKDHQRVAKHIELYAGAGGLLRGLDEEK